MSDLRQKQLARELQSVEQGRQNFLLKVDCGPDEVTDLNRDPVLYRAWSKNVAAFAAAIKEHVGGMIESRGYPRDFRARLKELFAIVSPPEAAGVVLLYALRHMYTNETRLNYAAVCRPAANSVIQQYNYKRFLEALPGYAKTVQQRQSRHPDHIGEVYKHLQKKHSTPTLEFDDREKIILGGALLHLLVESTGLFAFRESTATKGGRPTMVFQPTEKFKDWLEDAYAFMGEVSPIDVPMVCEPDRWAGPYQGGFLTNSERLARRPIIRCFYRDLRSSGFDRASSEVISAINRLQGIPWAINGFILDVVKAAQEAAQGLGGLPCKPLQLSLDEAAGPPPWQLHAMEKDAFMRAAKVDKDLAAEYTDWKHKRAREYDRFADEASARALLRTQICVAEELRNEEAIYFCYSMDWRGRVYVQQNCGLDPQSNDVGKALLQFARGKPLGPRGLYWLKVHAANCWGEDKVSFADRVRWADAHLQEILESGRNPLGFTWWADADKPFMFLAACRELYVAYSSPAPDGHVSHLPIGMDASCSGSQHFSALLRDPVGGAAVNLVPGDKPRDIYALVAAEAAKMMQGHPLGVHWLHVRGGWGRAWTKRNTMTFPYSASLYGFTDQLLEELREKNQAGVVFPVPAGVDRRQALWEFDLCQYLAEVNQVAIGRVMVKMAEAMTWLRDVARIIGKTGRDIQWTTPVGLRVVQRYRKLESKRLKLYVGDMRYDPRITVESKRPDVEGHRNGISPNFIHSLDAAHLMRVVLAYGGDIGVVHDSWSTHACDVDQMRDVIRDTFARIYENSNLLADLHSELQAANPDLELPPPPKQGRLDVGLVRESEYFIS